MKNIKERNLTSSNACLRTSGSYGVEGIASENHGGLYHRRNPPVLLEYMWPGGNTSKCSQSSFKPFSSDEIQTEPEQDQEQEDYCY